MNTLKTALAKSLTSLAPVLLTLTMIPQVSAERSSCTSIIDNLERLQCYDNENTPSTESISQESVVEDSSASEEPNVAIGTLVTINPELSEIEKRRKQEEQRFEDRSIIMPHRPSYILPVTYIKQPNTEPLGRAANFIDLDNIEAKFQISFKVPLVKSIWSERSSVWFGYTQRSLWQVYNSENSAPFRSTDYQPELLWNHSIPKNLLGLPLINVAVGLNHQSNGQGPLLSRSWNRIVSNFTFAQNRWSFMFEPWYRIPEDEDHDDNPDIHNYLGYANYRAIYKWDDVTISSLFRNNLKGENNHTSGTLSVSFPLPGRLKGYVEYVNAYGETLLDYDHRNKRIGVGMILNDWY